MTMAMAMKLKTRRMTTTRTTRTMKTIRMTRRTEDVMKNDKTTVRVGVGAALFDRKEWKNRVICLGAEQVPTTSGCKNELPLAAA